MPSLFELPRNQCQLNRYCRAFRERYGFAARFVLLHELWVEPCRSRNGFPCKCLICSGRDRSNGELAFVIGLDGEISSSILSTRGIGHQNNGGASGGFLSQRSNDTIEFAARSGQ